MPFIAMAQKWLIFLCLQAYIIYKKQKKTKFEIVHFISFLIPSQTF